MKTNKIVNTSRNATNEYYSKKANEYFETTQNIDTTEICSKFENLLKNSIKKKEDLVILDLGCGSGRDSSYLKKKKLNVISSDFSFELLKLCKKKNNDKTVNLDFNNIPFKKEIFTGIFANASLLHLPKKTINEVLNSLKIILKKNGILFFTLKQGEKETSDECGRFFSLYSVSEIKKIIKETEFNILSITVSDSIDGRNLKWITVCCKK